MEKVIKHCNCKPVTM